MQLTDYPVLLTEGAIVERLKQHGGITLDPYVNHATAIYDHPTVLGRLYDEYVAIAELYDLPLLIMTPTRKVNVESVKRCKYSDRNIAKDSVIFLRQIAGRHGSFALKVFVGGLLGCKGDAYDASCALGCEEAYEFHRPQVEQFARSGVDYLFAGIMPALSEAMGMAKAMGESGLPYIISFMVRKDGCLIDGTSIADAIATIDDRVAARPTYYMANCIHPKNLVIALEHPCNQGLNRSRFVGIQANASSLSPEELNNSTCVRQESFDEMVEGMAYLKEQHHLHIFGGCCGTDGVFIDKLAGYLKGAD